MTEIANCKLCGNKARIGEGEIYWVCDTCGVYGPDNDVSGEKWNRLMATTAEPNVRRPVQVIMQVEPGVGLHIVQIANDGTVWYLDTSTTWEQLPLLPQPTPEQKT